jgi:hypothetical protein
VLVLLLVIALLVEQRRASLPTNAARNDDKRTETRMTLPQEAHAGWTDKVRLAAVMVPPPPQQQRANVKRHQLGGARDLSSVDYHACCGLGHRMARMSDAYLVSRRLKLSFRAFWGYCVFSSNEEAPSEDRANSSFVEVFDYLFGPQPLQEQEELLASHQSQAGSNVSTPTQHPSPSWSHNYSFGHYLRLNNKVPHFKSLRRHGNGGAPASASSAGSSTLAPSSSSQSSCPCTRERRDSDVRFYLSLRERFRFRSRIDDFRRRHFGQQRFDSNSGTKQMQGEASGRPRSSKPPVVLGVHVRTGNGEGGDFVKKGRTVVDLDAWLESLARLLAEKQQKVGSPGDAVVVFVATDTPSVVPKLKALLDMDHPSNSSSISSTRMHTTVVSLDQPRPVEGSGVMFGQRSGVHNRDGTTCAEGWASVVSDMILLSHADAVIATRPSSFTQTLPLSLVFDSSMGFGRTPKEFCEVNAATTDMRCYRSYMDWCCNGTTRYSLGNYEYISVSKTETSTPEMYGGFRPRTAAATGGNTDAVPPPPGSGATPSSGTHHSGDEEERVCPPRGPGRKQDCIPYDWSAFYGAKRSPPA